MKKFILGLLITALALPAKAQGVKNSHKIKFSTAADIGLPAGDYYTIASLVYGGDIAAEYTAAEDIGVTLNVGYIRFLGKNGYKFSSGIIPVLAGARYYFVEEFYCSGELGISWGTKNGSGAVTFAPGVGYKLTDHFDFLLKYQAATQKSVNTDFLGLRAAFIF